MHLWALLALAAGGALCIWGGVVLSHAHHAEVVTVTPAVVQQCNMRFYGCTVERNRALGRPNTDFTLYIKSYESDPESDAFYEKCMGAQAWMECTACRAMWDVCDETLKQCKGAGDDPTACLTQHGVDPTVCSRLDEGFEPEEPPEDLHPPARTLKNSAKRGKKTLSWRVRRQSEIGMMRLCDKVIDQMKESTLPVCKVTQEGDVYRNDWYGCKKEILDAETLFYNTDSCIEILRHVPHRACVSSARVAETDAWWRIEQLVAQPGCALDKDKCYTDISKYMCCMFQPSDKGDMSVVQFFFDMQDEHGQVIEQTAVNWDPSGHALEWKQLRPDAHCSEVVASFTRQASDPKSWLEFVNYYQREHPGEKFEECVALQIPKGHETRCDVCYEMSLFCSIQGSSSAQLDCIKNNVHQGACTL